MKKIIISLFILCTLSISALAAPTLKYQNAGTFKYWCEESYYSAPVLCDIDSDSSTEIVYAAYGVTVLDAKTGSIKWRVNSGRDIKSAFIEEGGNAGFTWATAKIADIDADKGKEIVTGDSAGNISVLDAKGNFKPGFPVKLPGAVRAVTLCDIDSDGTSEILVGLGVPRGNSVYVLEHNGQIRSGWPQLSHSQNAETNSADYTNNGWGYGVFADGISAKDINGDGIIEILVPTDLAFLSVYTPDGKLVKVNKEHFGDRTWGKIPFYEDAQMERRHENEGWGFTFDGTQKRELLYRMELGHSGTAIKDLDKDGKDEIVVTGIMVDRRYGSYPPTEYMTLFILNGDRTRFNNTRLGFDWTHIPTDLGAPKIQSSKMLTSGVDQAPTLCDVDGDGYDEILFSSYNGKLHCFSLDGKEHGAFPFSLTKRSSPLIEYASVPAVYDIDSDGKNEVIFASFYDDTQKVPYGTNGFLYILNSNGTLKSKTALPNAKETAFSNGVRTKPAISDIDGDGKPEIILNTTHGGVCAYDV